MEITPIEWALGFASLVQGASIVHLCLLMRKVEKGLAVSPQQVPVHVAFDEQAAPAVQPATATRPASPPAALAPADMAAAQAVFGGTMAPLRLEPGEVFRRGAMLYRATGGPQIQPGMEVRRTE